VLPEKYLDMEAEPPERQLLTWGRYPKPLGATHPWHKLV
jgi:hypothetical protein